MLHNVISTAVVSGFLAASIAVSPPAHAAPAGPGSAQQTIDQLQADNYKVIVGKIGDAPLSSCTVTAIRPGHDVTTLVTHGDDTVETLLYTTVYVDVSC